MPLDTDSFVNLKDPVRKLLNETQSRLQDKAENYVIDAVGDALAKVGLGNKSRQGLLSNLADAAVAGIASEFFGTFSSAVDRLTKADIERDTGNYADVDRFENSPITNSANVGETSTSALIYPKDLNTYFIKFQFADYERPAPHVRAKFTNKFDVYLPIPRNLQESHSVGISTTNQGLWASAADSVIDYTQGRDVDQSGNSVAIGALAFTALAKRITMFKEAASAIGKTDDLFSIAEQMLGAIPNPNVSAIFKGPTLRKHTFEWMFAPNNAEESNEIRKIIKQFKASALPNRVTDTNTILQYPKICKIELHPWVNQGDDTYLFQFKNCLIENISFNYAPDSPVFVGGNDKNAPAFISMRVSFVEIEYFTANEFGREQTTIEGLYNNSQFDTVVSTLVSQVQEAALAAFDTTEPEVTDLGQVPTEASDIVFESSDGKYLRLRNGAWLKRTSGTGNSSLYQNIAFDKISDESPDVASQATAVALDVDGNTDAPALKLGTDIKSVTYSDGGKGQIVLLDPDRTVVRQR